MGSQALPGQELGTGQLVGVRSFDGSKAADPSDSRQTCCQGALSPMVCPYQARWFLTMESSPYTNRRACDWHVVGLLRELGGVT